MRIARQPRDDRVIWEVNGMTARRAWLVLCAAALVALVAVGAAGGAAAASAARTPDFRDPVGDAKRGPDLAALSIGESAVVQLSSGRVLSSFVLEFKVANLRPNPSAGMVEPEILTGLDTNHDHKM